MLLQLFKSGGRSVQATGQHRAVRPARQSLQATPNIFKTSPQHPTPQNTSPLPTGITYRGVCLYACMAELVLPSPTQLTQSRHTEHQMLTEKQQFEFAASVPLIAAELPLDLVVDPSRFFRLFAEATRHDGFQGHSDHQTRGFKRFSSVHLSHQDVKIVPKAKRGPGIGTGTPSFRPTCGEIRVDALIMDWWRCVCVWRGGVNVCFRNDSPPPPPPPPPLLLAFSDSLDSVRSTLV